MAKKITKTKIQAFVYDMAERAIKTFCQVLVATIPTSAITLGDVDWAMVLSASALATLLSVLTSIASYKFGEDGTASIVNG